MKTKTKTKLADIESDIELNFTVLKSGNAERRKVIIHIGKQFLAAQKECKAEGIAFKDWVAERSANRGSEKSPAGDIWSYQQVWKYMAIARYPSVFRADMSIAEAAKTCRYARKHGGEMPTREWKGGQGRRLITFQRKLGKSLTAIEKFIEEAPKLAQLKKEEKWTKDEIAGTIETLESMKANVEAMIAEWKSRLT